MRKFRIDRNSNELTSDISKLFSFIVEGDDFSWADKSKIERIEEKNDVFTFIRAYIEFSELAIEPCGGYENRGWLTDQ